MRKERSVKNITVTALFAAALCVTTVSANVAAVEYPNGLEYSVTIVSDTDSERADACDEALSITEEEASAFYEEFMELQSVDKNDEEYFSEKNLEEFAQYAVDNGIIEDTEAQRTALTKAAIRGELLVVAEAGNVLGFTTAGAYLKHSLQDTPSNLSYSEFSGYASQIAASSECKSIISKLKSDLQTSSFVSYTNSGSTTLSSTMDLNLAYRKVNYRVGANKANGKWTVTLTFTDTYDFNLEAWKGAGLDKAAATALNNVGAYAQSKGAVVPYNIQVVVKTTF